MSEFEQILITGGGRIICKRCQARSGRTKKQCSKPALKSKKGMSISWWVKHRTKN